MRGALYTKQRPMGVGDVAEGLGQVTQAVMASASLASRSLQRAPRGSSFASARTHTIIGDAAIALVQSKWRYLRRKLQDLLRC
jgi:hypothetical protein